MVDLKRIEQVITEFVAPVSRPQVREFFETWNLDKHLAFGKSMQAFQTFIFNDDELDLDPTSVAVMSFVAGVFMATMSQDESVHYVYFDQFLALRSRERGENVVDFAQERIKKQ